MLPIIFSIPLPGGGIFPIHTYGVLLALSFAAALFTTVTLAKDSGISGEDIGDVTLTALVAGLVGGRLLFVLVEWDQFRDHLSSIVFRRDGFVFYGGLLLAIPVTIAMVRRRKLPVARTADVLAPALALAHSIGRLGCFAQGCCYGAPSEYGVTFPPDAPASIRFGEVPVHPTQAYESVSLLLLFGLLLWARRRKLFDGAVFLLYMGCYAVIRFGIEFLRADDRGFYLGGLSISQLISIVVFTAAAILNRRLRPSPVSK